MRSLLSPPRRAPWAWRRILAGAAGLLATACAPPDGPAPQAPEARPPGGQATAPPTARPRGLSPAPNLPAERRPDFFAGQALARQPWVKAPTATTARDGLGPLYNARSCLACHPGGGRGALPAADGPLPAAALLRISLPGQDLRHGVIPEPRYGDQIQTRAVSLAAQLGRPPGPGALRPEARLSLRWRPQPFRYPDGETIALRVPEIQIEDLGYGPLDPDHRRSLRLAPPLHGAGLLDLIPDADLAALADPEDADGDGISGRLNQVWDPERGAIRPGRFGWKASRPDLRVQVAAALQGDLGLSNPVFPEQPCTEAQPDCAAGPHGAREDGLEVSAPLLALLVHFNANLSVPARRGADRPQVRAGEAHFQQVGCDRCHHPRHVTGPSLDQPHLAGQTLWPYTDLLLHDLGEGLADHREDFLASGREWRTAPLWGLGHRADPGGGRSLLHDGRARSVEEAILWHGGEAQASRDAFAALPRPARAALLAFVRSL